VQFVTDSIYLDDRPGARCVMAEPNLTMIIRRLCAISTRPMCAPSLPSASATFSALPRGEFNAVLAPAGPYEVPDEVGDGRPLLVVMSHESTAVPSDLRQPPPDIERFSSTRDRAQDPRTQEQPGVRGGRRADYSRTCATRCAGASLLACCRNRRNTTSHSPDYQRGKVKAEYEKLRLDVAMAILQCYRHLFYPSSTRMTGTQLDLGYTIIELSGAGDSPAMDSTRWNGCCTSRGSCSTAATSRIRRASSARRPACESRER